MDKVSVIITVFNRVELLRLALLSLMNQSMLPNELIVSDDGSDENVIEGISDLSKQCRFSVKYVGQANKGFRLAKCRNNGVRISTGEILVFLDQDLIHTKKFLESMIRNSNPKKFITSYPVRLTKFQTDTIIEKIVVKTGFENLINSKQKNKIKLQFIKDNLACFFHSLNLRTQGPKLRGGACAINRGDFYEVNGYDEKYIGWGNEDDDLKRRLYKNNVNGYNPSYNQYPIHLYHEPFHQNGERVNIDYNKQRMKEIAAGNFRCEFGVENPFGEDQLRKLELN